MNSTLHCRTRSELEHQMRDLVAKQCNLITRLLSLAGGGPQESISTEVDCASTHEEIRATRQQLHAHRAEHGC